MLELRPGRNVWVWARTDRDAPSSDDVIRSCASVMSRLLPDVVPGVVPPPSPKGPAGASRYFMGAARPMDVSASQTRPPLPKGLAAWNYTDQPQLYGVAAERPWWAVVDLDWRGPTFTVDPWPTRKVNALGVAIDDPLRLDWLLMHAAHLGPATRPDGDWTSDAATVVTDTATTAARAGLGLLVIAGLVWLTRK